MVRIGGFERAEVIRSAQGDGAASQRVGSRQPCGARISTSSVTSTIAAALELEFPDLSDSKIAIRMADIPERLTEFESTFDHTTI